MWIQQGAKVWGPWSAPPRLHSGRRELEQLGATTHACTQDCPALFLARPGGISGVKGALPDSNRPAKTTWHTVYTEAASIKDYFFKIGRVRDFI